MSKAPAVNAELGSTDHFPVMGFSEVWDSVLVPTAEDALSWHSLRGFHGGGTALLQPGGRRCVSRPGLAVTPGRDTSNELSYF